jgi:hypothetical protein
MNLVCWPFFHCVTETDHGSSRITKVTPLPLYSPVISQHPAVGKSTPVNMAVPISEADAFVFRAGSFFTC